jgi:hypothetical protein
MASNSKEEEEEAMDLQRVPRRGPYFPMMALTPTKTQT